MAETNERVMDMVRRELEKNPGIDNEALRAKAVRIDPSLSRLSTRQFHAKYPLQVKRAKKRAGGRTSAVKGGRSARKTTKRAGGGARKGAKRGRRAAGAGAAETGSAAPRKRRGRRATAGGNGRKRRARALRGPAASATGGGREGVRAVLLDFARQVATANERADLIDVVSSVDGWVDRILQQAGR